MTDKLRAAAQAALDALERVKDSRWDSDSVAGRKLLADLSAALANPTELVSRRCPRCWEPMLVPGRREWVSLTDEEIRSCWEFPEVMTWMDAVYASIRCAEAALKEKNHD